MDATNKDKLQLYICCGGYNISDNQLIINNIIKQYENINFENKESNFPLVDTDNGDLKKLYDDFVEKSKKIFGPFNILDDNNFQCWGVVTNRVSNDYKSVHNHTKSSTINGVYYVKVPETEAYEDGSISFYWPDAHVDNLHEIFCYKPRNNDLIIMPNYLKHDRNYCSSEEYRIAINMEIKCNLNWNENLFK